MANLDLVKKLNKQYGKSSPVQRETKLFAINESIDPNKIVKSLPDSLASMGVAYTTYFDLGLPAEVALLFIDVCGFSTRFGNLSGEEVSSYFDEYYDLIIPIIYQYDGEIDKILGDGIICVFGPPFSAISFEQILDNANVCAKKIIMATKGTKFSSKVAFHCGRVNYFKNKTGLYKEFTMVGKPLTELFRLESVSLDNCINYYDSTNIRTYYQKKIMARFTAGNGTPEWIHDAHNLPKLNGVSDTVYHSIRWTNP